MATLSTLPPELLVRIVFYCCPPPNLVSLREPSRSQLLTLLTINSAFYPAVQLVLLSQRIELQTSTKRLPRLYRFLESAPDKRRYVVELGIFGSRTTSVVAVEQLLELCENLRSLSITGY
ncbi:hypothetical protein BT69DRAFT_1329257 [Atractiella rhizophila]|nr:hypothetical protein BT69DRAFT_1329257 [Atractiella rhizophila]